MTTVLVFLSGMVLGGSVGIFVMCLFQISKTNGENRK